MIELREPGVELLASFLEFKEDLRSVGEVIWEPYFPLAGESPVEFVARQKRRETKPEPPSVAETTWWGTLNGQVAGRISLRHELNERLRKYGGHIGYEVSPKFRRRGVATEMLRRVLLTPKAREIGRLLLTCSPGNPASNRTIIVNGGVLEQTLYVDFIGEDRNHYWITADTFDGPRSQ
jgi:predicted acetyltransferase